MKPVLCTTRRLVTSVSVVQTMEPGSRRRNHRGQRRGRRQDQPHRLQPRRYRVARDNIEHQRHDPRRDRRQIEYPVRVGRIQHLLAGLQDIVDITPHWSPQLPCMRFGGRAGSRLLAPNRAVMYTRLFARASHPLCALQYRPRQGMHHSSWAAL